MRVGQTRSVCGTAEAGGAARRRITAKTAAKNATVGTPGTLDLTALLISNFRNELSSDSPRVSIVPTQRRAPAARRRRPFGDRRLSVAPRDPFIHAVSGLSFAKP
jgi:hypothetical protein